MDHAPGSGEREEPSGGLSPDEHKGVSERRAGSARIIHEVVREQGDEELDRPVLSLLLSGLAAGLSISVSLLAQAFLKARLPAAAWSELIVGLGYTIGFIIVVLGRLQLFTESTVTAVLPVAAEPNARNLLRLLRLWSLVLAANLVGTFFVAWLAARSIIVSPEQRAAMIEIAREILGHDAPATLCLGIPAGFLVASIAWILPNARGSEIFVVIAITYVIAIGGFSHIVAGSSKAWVLWLTGESPLDHVLLGLVLPSLAGNIVGGTGLFALLAHGQVRHEL